MSAIEPVSVDITADSAVPTQQGFGRVLILGYHTLFPELARVVSDLSEMTGLGFPVHHPLYRMASAIKSQSPAPVDFLVGRLPASFAWKYRLTMTSAVAGQHIQATLDCLGVTHAIDRTIPGSSSLGAEATAVAALISAIGATPPAHAMLMGQNPVYGHVGAGHQLVLAIPGPGTLAVTFTGGGGGENTEGDYLVTLNGQLTGAYSAVDDNGRIRIVSTATGAAQSLGIDGSSDSDVLDALGMNPSGMHGPPTIQHGADATSLFAATASGTDVNVSMATGHTPFWIRDIVNANVVNTSDTGNFDTALAAIQLVTDDWYGLAIETQAAEDIMAVAAWVEPARKVFLATFQDTREADSGTAVLSPFLRSEGYAYTAPFYHPRGEYLACALGGVVFAYSLDNGMIPTWAYRSPVGVSVYGLTTAQATAFRGNNVNVFATVHGIRMVWEGTMAGGQYGDITVSLDWLRARVKEAVFGYLASQRRVPYTDDGIQHVGDVVWGVLSYSARSDVAVLAPTPTITLPKAADVSSTDRGNRLLGGGGIKFSGVFAGSIQKVAVNGTVTF